MDMHQCAKSKPCPDCGGHGANRMSDNVNWLPCWRCGGKGVIAEGEWRDFAQDADATQGRNPGDYDEAGYNGM